MNRKLISTLLLSLGLALPLLARADDPALSGQDVIRQLALPLAKANDGDVFLNEMYTYEELAHIAALAEEKGVSLDNDAGVMLALARGEGYYETETIMAICREAFGGLISQWTPEQQWWYGEIIVELGYAKVNDARLPGEGELSSAEVIELAAGALHARYGADIPLEDAECYRVTALYVGGDWHVTFQPRSLERVSYSATLTCDGRDMELSQGEPFPETYTETYLMGQVSRIYGSSQGSLEGWGPEGWYAFGQRLPAACRSERWTLDYDGYLATTYLLPGEDDLSAAAAKTIALEDAGVTFPVRQDVLLLGDGDRRIWKVNLTILNPQGGKETRSWEIDAQTGEILYRMTIGGDVLSWAQYMLHDAYAEVNRCAMNGEEAKAIAIAALREAFGDDGIPLDDTAFFDESIYRFGGVGQPIQFNCTFTTRTLNYGDFSILVSADGGTEILRGDAEPLCADNLLDRFGNLYGSCLTWEQSVWVLFDQTLDTLPAPATFEGRLFAMTRHPEASSVPVSREQALETVQRTLGTKRSAIVSWVLIDAEPNPVWKIRASTNDGHWLFEVDAVTGEIIDREICFIQRDDIDHDMKMLTTRATYMPEALNEFGPVRIAMELTVKADYEVFRDHPTLFMNPADYTVTVEDMTVTFTSVDGTRPSYRTTILDNSLDAEIKVLDIP